MTSAVIDAPTESTNTEETPELRFQRLIGESRDWHLEHGRHVIEEYEAGHADGHQCATTQSIAAALGIAEAADELGLEPGERAVLLAIETETQRTVGVAEGLTKVLDHVLGLAHARKGWLPNDVNTFVTVLLGRVLGTDNAAEYITAACYTDDLDDPRENQNPKQTVKWSYVRRPWSFWRNPHRAAASEVLDLIPDSLTSTWVDKGLWLHTLWVEADVPEHSAETAWLIFARRGGWSE